MQSLEDAYQILVEDLCCAYVYAIQWLYYLSYICLVTFATYESYDMIPIMIRLKTGIRSPDSDLLIQESAYNFSVSDFRRVFMYVHANAKMKVEVPCLVPMKFAFDIISKDFGNSSIRVIQIQVKYT